jgi:hypothetical protein
MEVTSNISVCHSTQGDERQMEVTEENEAQKENKEK